MIKRIAIMGCSGSGKSTLARQLGERLGLPVHHIDALNWQPGWVMQDADILLAQVQAILATPEWIIDGGYSQTDPDEVRYREVDVLILLKRSVWLSLYRVIRRVFQYRGKTRPDMGEGCPEKVDFEFLWFIWNYRWNNWVNILERVERNGTPHIILRKDTGIDDLVREIEALMQKRS